VSDGSQAKICVFCGKDCAGIPRVRDARGRYACRPCVEVRRKKGAPPDDDLDILSPDPESLDALDAFDPPDEPSSTGAYVALAPEESTERTVPCGACGALMLTGHKVCARCGMDHSRGAGSSSLVHHRAQGKRRVLTCVKCDYDMTGVPGLVCPECGTRQPVRTLNLVLYEKPYKANKWKVAIPTAMLLVGLGGVSVLVYGTDSTIGVMYFLLMFSAVFALDVGLLWIFVRTRFDMDQPFPLAALNLAGICAALDLFTTPFQLYAPLGIVLGSFVFAFVAYIILLRVMLGLKGQDPGSFAGVTVVINTVAMVALSVVLDPLFGL